MQSSFLAFFTLDQKVLLELQVSMELQNQGYISSFQCINITCVHVVFSNSGLILYI